MTELLYHTDAYLKQFTATVTGIDAEKRGVLLDRTAFYPGGGGQPNDTGVLRLGDRVYNVVKVEKGNLHILDTDELPPVGAQMEGEIDWERRYKLMRTHTAMH